MNNIESILQEIDKLLKTGGELLNEGQNPKMEVGRFGPLYEVWYTKSLQVVTQIIPERLTEFKEAYRHEKRKEVSYDTYAISDYLLNLRVLRGGSPVFNTTSAFAVKMVRQIGILNAAAMCATSVLRDIRATLRAELLDSDLQGARDLLKAGHLRASGVICGVILETHLLAICQRHSIKVTKKDPGIGDLNDLLKNGSVYDVPIWRLIQRLADIRNLCGHKKERDPKVDEVQDLISGVDKIMKEIA